jgi:hypothetical protein
MSTFDDSANEKAMETVLTTTRDILSEKTIEHGKDVPGYRNNFYIEGINTDGAEITVIFTKGKSTRHTLIYSKGNPQ